MQVASITPVLNVSNLKESFAWFKRIGWAKKWDWGTPPTYGCVESGEANIFLCLNGQGGRGKGDNTGTSSEDNGETADQGVWLSVWVENVDHAYAQCKAEDIEILHPPEGMPWQVREMHIRHPDGHVFRISMAIN